MALLDPRNLRPMVLRSAWWALAAARDVRRQLEDRVPPADVAVPPPPELPPDARRGVAGALHRTRATCLVRAIVQQAWDSAHGEDRDVVIGVTAPKGGFRAHAWLQDSGSCDHDTGEFHELTRRPPPTGPPSDSAHA